ncbi:unnamed protein product [Acanthoscelides obtectus]|uniref:ATP-dependent DNA helicase n=1 Tax=Acanthoscelides obtectus TaxID=200917 RepID=A0A9P0QBL3_ACAOB|nr:unnamed protein product [Acanthoscelides obtectus]
MPKKKRGNNWYAKKRIIKNPTTISINDSMQDEPEIEQIAESMTVEQPQPGPSTATHTPGQTQESNISVKGKKRKHKRKLCLSKRKKHTVIHTASLHSDHSSSSLTSSSTIDQQMVIHNTTASSDIPIQTTTKGKMNKGKTPLKKSKKPNEPLQSTLPVISQHLIQCSVSQSNEEVFINEASRIITAFPNNHIAIPGPSRLSNTSSEIVNHPTNIWALSQQDIEETTSLLTMSTSTRMEIDIPLQHIEPIETSSLPTLNQQQSDDNITMTMGHDELNDILANLNIDNLLENTNNIITENVTETIHRRGNHYMAATNHYTGLYTLGTFTFTCSHCRALHFLCEKNSRNVYSNCCKDGAVHLPPFDSYPEQLRVLFQDREFMENVRYYNNSFAFASLATNTINPPGRGPYVFKVQGEIRHYISNVSTNISNERRQYGNLYFLDTELANQLRSAGPQNRTELNRETVDVISNYMHSHNPFAQAYRFLKDVYQEQQHNNRQLTLELYINNNRARDINFRQYGAVQANEIAAVFISEDGRPPLDRCLHVYCRDNDQIIHELPYLSVNCDAMTYPLLHPRGEPGWQSGTAHQRRRGKLTQQYIVDAYVKIEQSRLQFITENQPRIRQEIFQGLIDYLDSRQLDVHYQPGNIFILPSTFIGSPRAFRQNYLDAMSIVTKHGKPDIFLTFTCNPVWPEIRNNLDTNQHSSNRPDFVSRVFKSKLKELIEDIDKRHVMGICVAYVYVIEFQKRGLPHAHMLIWLEGSDKILDSAAIDRLISAEFPDPITHPNLHELVKVHMLHGPCTAARCLDDEGHCSKQFPKSLREDTLYNSSGYPLYKRRPIEVPIHIGRRTVDNGWVVPYNAYLLEKYEAHINVEACSSIKSVKYLFKYIYKGFDRAQIVVRTVEEQDGQTTTIQEPIYNEIQTFMDVRYVSAPEAMWRIYTFEMHDMSHAIIKLTVHLPNMQQVYFNTNSKSNRDFQLPLPTEPVEHLIEDEYNYDQADEQQIANRNIPLLNQEQRLIFNDILLALNENERVPHRLFFINGIGGAGKTFLLNTLLAYLLGNNHRYIAMCYTGIAASLLKNGQTIHSSFMLPVPFLENSTSKIRNQSTIADNIRYSKIIVIDEISMVHKSIFNEIDRKTREIMNNDIPFGGKIIIILGDFRQCAPIVPLAGKNETISASVKCSQLWQYFVQYDLVTNVRALPQENEFKDWLMTIGNNSEILRRLENSRDTIVKIPNRIIVEDVTESIYGSNLTEHDFTLLQKAILSPLNIHVKDINSVVLEKLPGRSRQYLSVDSIIREDDTTENAADDLDSAWPQDFLNSLDAPGLPPHILTLKIGAVIILTKNLDVKRGLCNGTRLLIHNLHENFIEAKRVEESNNEPSIEFISRVDNIALNSLDLPVNLKRRQFPVRLAFAMTINKSQGQTLNSVGLFLPVTVFDHGQLYVALSRARSFENLKIQMINIGNRQHVAETPNNHSYTVNVTRHQTPDTRHQIADTRYQIPDTRYQIPDIRYQIPDTRHQIPDTRYQIDARHQIPDTDTRYQTTDTRYQIKR